MDISCSNVEITSYKLSIGLSLSYSIDAFAGPRYTSIPFARRRVFMVWDCGFGQRGIPLASITEFREANVMSTTPMISVIDIKRNTDRNKSAGRNKHALR